VIAIVNLKQAGVVLGMKRLDDPLKEDKKIKYPSIVLIKDEYML